METTKEPDYYLLKRHGTGSHDEHEDYKTVICLFDKYEIVIRLSPANEFIGIEQVKINKDFLSLEQKLSLQNYFNVEQFYKEEE